METKIKILHNIEPESKLEKLEEEFIELTVEVKKYINNPSNENMELVINELIDVSIVILQLAFIKNGYYMAEIWSMAKDKVNLNVCIYKTMKKLKIGYKAARKIVRG